MDENKLQLDFGRPKDILADLNDQQKKAVTHKTGPLLIIAGAGSGKTAVITRRIAHIIEQKWAKPSEILALTFTEKAAAEMEQRVDELVPYGYTDMWISTFHAFGDRFLRDYAINLGLPANFKVLTATEQAIFLRQNIFAFDLNYYRPIANPLSHIQELLTHFSRLKDELIAPGEYLALAESLKLKAKSKEEKIEYEKTLELAKAYQRYQELMIQSGNLDFGDQIFLTYKLLKKNKKVLKECQEKFRYILVDEFQDTNYAQNELVKLIAGRAGNITVVGDDDQCLPPDTLISIPTGKKRIKNLRKGDEVITAVGKGHISTSRINKIESVIKNKKLITFKTEKGKEITVTDNHKMFCHIPIRTKGYWYVYLMNRQNLGWRLGITTDLITRLRLERSADKIIGLRAFISEDEARYYEMLWALQYSIPVGCFKERDGIAIKNDWLKKLYHEINSEKNAQRLAAELGIDFDSHHFCLNAVVRGQSKRIVINVNICQRKYISKSSPHNRPLTNPKVIHEVNLETSDPQILKILQVARFKLVKAKKGYRIRIQSNDIQKIKTITTKLQKLTGGIIENKFTVGFYKYKTEPALVMPASNLLEGHLLPVLHGNKIIYERIIEKKTQIKKITTYDLEIERTHNFIANDIVVHNSIYRFRGAAISNILDFKKSYKKAKEIVLNQNYRSTQEIMNSSYKLIQHNNPDRLELQNNINKKLIAQKYGVGPELLYCESLSCEADKVVAKIGELKIEKNYKNNDFAILVRANSQAEPFIQSLNMAGIPSVFSGASGLYSQPEIKMLVAFLKCLTYTDDNLAFYQLATSEIYGVSHQILSEIYTLARRSNRGVVDLIKKNIAKSDDLDKLREIVTDIEKYREKKNDPVGEVLYNYLSDKGYLKKLSKNPSVEDELKITNIAKFFDRIAQFNHSSDSRDVLSFLENLELILSVGDEVATSDIDPDLDAINILTVHAAKGLEWPVVFVANCVADRFPTRKKREQLPIPEQLIKERLPIGDWHQQEERRLFYVAATRAKDYLFLTAAEDYGGKRVKKLSQFVLELLDEPNPEKLKHKLSAVEKIERFKKLPPFAFRLPPRFSEKILRLSRQQIDDYYSCPKKFYYAHIVKIPLLENQQFMYGSAIHAALDHYFARKIAGLRRAQSSREKLSLEQLHADFKNAFKNVGFITRDQEEMRFKQGLDTLARFFDQDQKDKAKPAKVEEVFEFLQGDVKVKGRFDLIYGIGESTEIRDFKTSDVRDQKDADRRIKESTQMMIYALAWERKYGIIPKTTLYFIESGLKGETTFKKMDLDKTRTMISEVAEGIRKQNMTATPDIFQCKYCPYRDICPEAV